MQADVMQKEAKWVVGVMAISLTLAIIIGHNPLKAVLLATGPYLVLDRMYARYSTGSWTGSYLYGENA